MVTINGTLLKDLFNDSEISVTTSEIIIDQSISDLNLYGSGLSHLTGVAGSKTGTYTSAEQGAIMTMSTEVYAKQYKNPSDKTSGTLGPAGSSFSTRNQLLEFAKEIASQLKLASAVSDATPPIIVYNDPVE